MKKILIYGCGKYFEENRRVLEENFEIVGIVDSSRKEYKGKKVCQPAEICSIVHDYVVIMVQNSQFIYEIVNSLVTKYHVSSSEIVIGLSLMDKIKMAEESYQIEAVVDGNIKINYKGLEVKASSVDEFNNLLEIYRNKTYQYYINNGRQDIVLDVGMNVGGSIFYFLADNKVDKIYGYEPFPETYGKAWENLKRNDFPSKVETFSIGWGDANRECIIKYNRDMTCGQSTLENVNQEVVEQYESWGLISEKQTTEVTVEIRRASEILKPIVKEYASTHNIVLKMDCEGSEYEIIRELEEADILKAIKMIMVEWHYKGNEELLTMLKRGEFSYWCMDKGSDMGLIYAMR